MTISRPSRGGGAATGAGAEGAVVGTDAGYHSRLRAGNGRITWTTEVYTRRKAALDAIEFLTGNPIVVSPFAEHPEVSWAGNPETVTEVRFVDEVPS